MQKIAKLPFSGFYCTVHDSNLDNALHDNPESGGNVHWCKVFREYSIEYVKQFSDAIHIPLKFESLNQPSSYNFNTDRIFVYIDVDDIQKMKNDVNDTILCNLIKDRCTSCDGFISFYPNDLDSWNTDLSTWDHNQLSILLEAYYIDTVGPLDENALMNDTCTSGTIEEWIANAIISE